MTLKLSERVRFTARNNLVHETLQQRLHLIFLDVFKLFLTYHNKRYIQHLFRVSYVTYCCIDLFALLLYFHCIYSLLFDFFHFDCVNFTTSEKKLSKFYFINQAYTYPAIQQFGHLHMYANMSLHTPTCWVFGF